MQRLPPGDLDNMVVVGEGGFGLVYRAWSRTLGMEIALKKCVQQRHDGSKLEDLMKERDLMHKANFTYVLRLLAVYENSNGECREYGLVMEYMPHGSLHTLFNKIPDVPWALRFRILHQVALGMNYLHHVLVPPIVHQDLKPRNVLLNKVLDVQLTDFGLSKTLTSASTYSTGGTLAYMPPEALEDVNYKPSKAFDVYSFGILTWSVLSGQEPYSDCIQVTQSMLKEYAGQIDLAVEDALSRLKDLNTQEKQGPSFVGLSAANVTTGTSGGFRHCLRMLNDTIDGPPPIVSSASPDVSNNVERTAGQVNSIRKIQFNAPKNAKEFIKKNFSTIVTARPYVGAILPALFSERIFNQEELSVIESSGTAENQTRNILVDVMNKGQRSSVRFLELLAEHHPSLVESLVPL
ncbi:receptor-interacting serine/threonine-protein kinase 2 isoform X3 [Xenopus laevis]|uniref:Receptor-interacting serine/threonine-protein kinase 2 isoform X3 n=1 Tax=Xenopus laevis TaxID=8355 RepID=A0A8J0TJW0_XENLA|nr:receptor-interacting serine/threonine-protein kinase 2 isoform X3 [Xenopus laevis]